jgi:hypothetical protein
MKKIAVFSLICCSLQGLEENPWLGNAYEWNACVSESYSRYRFIDNAKVQPQYAYNNYDTDLSLSVTLGASLLGELELEMARTPHQTFGFRSMALYGQYQILDDIIGDVVSLTCGLSARAVTGRAVRDVSSPYASYLNGEFSLSIGKEWIYSADWNVRWHMAGMIGLANHGSFWNRALAAIEAKVWQNASCKLFLEGYFGYGRDQVVDIDHFHGWGYIRHGSLDIGGSYQYALGLWGEIGLSYAYRVIAYSYPQNTQTATLFYRLPFSFF